MKLLKNLLNLFKKKQCNHLHYHCRKYRNLDGTPMIYFRCYDCYYEDYGHVYADEWPANEVTDIPPQEG
jgi:hypothetical protein